MNGVSRAVAGGQTARLQPDPEPGLVLCDITRRGEPTDSGAGPFDGLWQPTFLGQDGVDMAAARFGRRLLPHGADTPDWAIVVAPGVIRMTGRDLEQSWWADRRSIEPRCSRRKPGKRAEVTCWTRKSRAKMALTLASLDWSYLEDATGLPAMVTLTYPGNWLPVASSGQAVKKHLGALLKRWQRAWGEPLTGAWKLEFQARGAPHVHIGPVVIPLGTAGEGLPFHKWLSLTWADIVNHPDPDERALHELAGTGVDYGEGLRCSDPKRLAVYFSKHGAYRAKDYQNQVPAEWREQGATPGRFWGYWNLRPCRAAVELRKHEHLAVSRALRGLSGAGRPWDRDARVPAVRKIMRQERRALAGLLARTKDPIERRRLTGAIEKITRQLIGGLVLHEVTGKRSAVRLDKTTGVLVPVRKRKRKLRRPVRRLKNHRGFVCVNDGPGLAVTLARLIETGRQDDMIMIKELARCLVRGCPVRYPTGEPRLCHDHERETVGSVTEAAEALGIELGNLARQAPVGHAVQERRVALPLLAGTAPGPDDGGSPTSGRG